MQPARIDTGACLTCSWHTIPGLNPSAAHTLVRLSLSKCNDHYACSLPPALVREMAIDCDIALLRFYERCYDKASNGSSASTSDVAFNAAARSFMFLPADSIGGGMGLSSLDDLVGAGSYLVGLSSALTILKAQKHRQRDPILAHLRRNASIQPMLDRLHKRLANFPASSQMAARKAVPPTLAGFLSSTSGPRRTSHTVNRIAKEHRLTLATALFDTDTSMIGGSWKRTIEARAARLNVTQGSAVFTLPRSRYDTSLSGPAFLLALSDFAGLDIPGSADLHGHACYCTGINGTAANTDHLHTCGKHGRWHIYNRVRDVMARLISQRGNSNISFVQHEPRGTKLFPDLAKAIGPDAEYRIHGNRVLADFSGIADTAPNYRPLWIAKLCTHTTQLKLSLAEALQQG